MTTLNKKIEINLSFSNDAPKVSEPESKPSKECITCCEALNKANKKRCVCCDQAVICRECSRKLDKCPVCRKEHFGVIETRNVRNVKSFKQINSNVIELIYEDFFDRLTDDMANLTTHSDEPVSSSTDEIVELMNRNIFFKDLEKIVDPSSPDKAKILHNLIDHLEFLDKQPADVINEYLKIFDEEILNVSLFDYLIDSMVHDNDSIDNDKMHEIFGEQMGYMMFAYIANPAFTPYLKDGYTHTAYSACFFYVRTLLTEIISSYATYLQNHRSVFIKLLASMFVNRRVAFEIFAANLTEYAISHKDDFEEIPPDFDDC